MPWKRAGPRRPPPGRRGEIQIFEDDPFLQAVAGSDPVHAVSIPADVPNNTQPSLQTHPIEQQPAPELYDPSTAEFRYWDADSALARAINFWGPLLPSGTVWSTNQQPMQVNLDEGEDFNAFYARDSGLNFFHGQVDRVDPPVTVFSGASPDVSCHELGHAILDAVKPELFDAMSMEVAAFHEAFGDISSTLSAPQLPSMRDLVLQQTGGRLNSNSRLSQLARQLGWAIRVQVDPTAVDNDCLRNTSNNFFYQDPTGLPPSAPATQLSSEPHSFSRVFSGAFLDVLAAMFKIGPANSAGSDSDNLLAVTVDAGTLLIEGVRVASVAPGFYSQVAAGMVQADQSLTGGRYGAALTSSFVQARDPLPYGGCVPRPGPAGARRPGVRHHRPCADRSADPVRGRERRVQEDREGRPGPSAPPAHDPLRRHPARPHAGRARPLPCSGRRALGRDGEDLQRRGRRPLLRRGPHPA